MYKTKWDDKADDDLTNISPEVALKIYKKVETHLSQSPKELGRPLTGNHKGLYRYRYGDYRILYEIDTENNLIIINRVGHRSSIY
tara:strand:+ start:3228 stop:3482 length:255 start_codon:yes stop_codon:yes gene_type:complete